MSSAAWKLVQDGAKRREIEKKAGSPKSDFAMVDVTVDLYPEEIVRAAQEALGRGPKGLSDAYVDLYLFAYDASIHNLPVQATQLSGVLLSHKKVCKWIQKNNVISVVELKNPAVLDAFIRFHMKNKADSEEVLGIILRTMLSGEL